MRKSLLLLSLSSLLPMFAGAAELDTAVPFRALVSQDGSAPVSIEVEVAPGAMRTVELDHGWRLEFTAPADSLGFTTVRLLRPRGDELLPLHTDRQPLRKAEQSRNGYLICGDEVVFMPVGQDEQSASTLAGCRDV